MAVMMASVQEGGNASRRKVGLVAVIVVCAGAAAWIVWSNRSVDGPPQEMDFVCVATGRIERLSVEEAGLIPAKNHETGERTMVPCVLEDDGRYRVPQRYRAILSERLAEENRFVGEDGYVRSSRE